MTVTVYRSTDTSAPSLTGQAGSLITVLDAVLVNGYGSKTAAGWGKALSGTNVAAYRPASGNRFYLGVDDSDAQNARMRGFEAMGTAGVAQAGSGNTGPFPTDTQVSGGAYVYKSSAASAQVRPWLILASATFFVMFYDNGQASATPNTSGYQGVFYFGDFFPLIASDLYNTCIGGNTSASSGSPTHLSDSITNVGTTNAVATYAPRGYAGSGGAVAMSRLSFGYMLTGSQASGSATGATVSPYPANGVGGLMMAPILLIEAPATGSCAHRGVLPCVFFMPHSASVFTQGDTFSGATSTQLAGRTFEIVRERFNNGGFFVETSNWAAVTF